jgi:hypothetical protein
MVRRCPSGTRNAGVSRLARRAKARTSVGPTPPWGGTYGLHPSGRYRALRGNSGFLFRLSLHCRSAETFFAVRVTPREAPQRGLLFLGDLRRRRQGLSRAKRIIGVGWDATEPRSSIRPSAAPVSEAGPSARGGGSPLPVGSSRRSTRSSSTSSACGGSGAPTRSGEPGWRRG